MAPAKLGLTALAVLALAAGGYFMVAPSCAAPAPTVSLPPEPEPIEDRQPVEIDGRTFDLELALNNAQRVQGLSDRRSIAEDGGMLFVYPFDRVMRFVMRRCHVPIDIVFLDADGRVVQMHAMEVIEPIGGDEWYNPTDDYSSVERARFAIELRGGTLETLGIEVGDVVELPLEDLKRRAR